MRQTTGSDRNFGFAISLFLLVSGVWPVLRHASPRYGELGIAAGVLLVTLTTPSVLHPLNVLWTKLGVALGTVTTPVFAAFVFFLVFTPVAWVMRLWKRDALSLALDPDAASYWIPREPPSPEPRGMIRQF